MEPDHDRALETQCARVLYAGAARAGTRQQVRAAARRFVRRHRRDRSYLRWVVRCVRASSALAVALLGLSVAPAAGADPAPFAARTGAANPLDGQLVAGFLAPALGDLDGDGDLDLVAGETDGIFHYFENTGSATSPAFVQRTGAANFLDGVQHEVNDLPVPALSDLDGDGDLDLIAGSLAGIFYLENTGNATTPAFGPAQLDPALNLSGGLYTTPALGDLDGDGDLDLLVGEYYGTFLVFENTGSATSAAFVQRSGGANPLTGQNAGIGPNPALGDLDGDGDLGLISGSTEEVFRYYENQAGGLVQRTGAANPLDGEDVGDRSRPALGDLDGDGDLVAGEQGGTFFYYETRAAQRARPSSGGRASATRSSWWMSETSQHPSSATSTATATSTSLLESSTDWSTTSRTLAPPRARSSCNGRAPRIPRSAGAFCGNNQRRRSAISMATATSISSWAGTWVPRRDPSFTTSKTPGARRARLSSYPSPILSPVSKRLGGQAASFGDLDEDGDLDLALSAYGNRLAVFENTGSATSPAFVQPSSNTWFGPILFGSSSVSIGDLDGDGDFDLVAGDLVGTFT